MKTKSIKDILEDDILSGAIKMGERLNEERLAQRFGVSRTPIRESFRLLASSGLIELLPRRGAFVKELSLVEIIEMFEVMAEQEALCARLSAKRITDKFSKQLERSFQACLEMKNVGDSDGYYFENRQFHFTLYESSGNQFLAEEAKKLHLRLQPFRRLQLQTKSRLEQSNQEHEGLLQAIKSGHSKEAADIARAHVAIQGEKVGQLLSALKAY